MGRIKTTKKEHRGRLIDQTELQVNYGLTFSFKYLDLQDRHGDFSLDHSEDGYTKTLLSRLKGLSGMTISEFRHNKGLRAHPIDFSGTAHKKGFSHLNEQLRDKEPWQFQLTSNKHGRVHGLLIAEIFYVIWLDPDHRLFPTKTKK